jgi:uncharacterized damage-inducible protein DinB
MVMTLASSLQTGEQSCGVLMAANEFLEQYRRLARANAFWNRNLYRALHERTDLRAARIYGTLQHILAADEVWLARFSGSDPDLACLEVRECECEQPGEFWFKRLELDETTVLTLSQFTGADLIEPVSYHDFRGSFQHDPMGICLARFLNHQQHHQFRIEERLRREHDHPDDIWDCAHYF